MAMHEFTVNWENLACLSGEQMTVTSYFIQLKMYTCAFKFCNQEIVILSCLLAG